MVPPTVLESITKIHFRRKERNTARRGKRGDITYLRIEDDSDSVEYSLLQCRVSEGCDPPVQWMGEQRAQRFTYRSLS